MGFKWNDAWRGGVNGFKAGSRFGPYGMIIGTAAGAVSGGYGKDIDKGLTGNSQSGTVEGLLDMAGSTGGNGYGQAAGAAGNLFTRGADKKAEEGYENNPAVLARQNQGDGGGETGSIFNASGGGGDYSGIMNLFNRGGGSSSTSDESGDGLDINTILQLISSSKNSGSSGGGYAGMLSNLFSRN